MTTPLLKVGPIYEYFLFLADDDIRVKGTRIGIEHILYEYIHNAKSPEAMQPQDNLRFGLSSIDSDIFV